MKKALISLLDFTLIAQDGSGEPRLWLKFAVLGLVVTLAIASVAPIIRIMDWWFTLWGIK